MGMDQHYGSITTSCSMNMIKKIVIVGGGFAGWYTACSIQHNLPDHEIVLIESPNHPTMSVGEVTGFDAPINFRRLVGITDEAEMVRETGAIFKYGIRAVDFFQDHVTHQWGKFPNLKVSSLTSFYNGYDYPEFEEPWNRRPGDIGLFMAWMSLNHNKSRSYRDFVLETAEQNHFITEPIAPYNHLNRYVLRNNQGYAYHLDAQTTSKYLEKLFKSRSTGNFKHITASVDHIEFDSQQHCTVKSLQLSTGETVSGDLFIDATGLKRLLVKGGNNDSWQYAGDLYCNATWAAPTRYLDPAQELVGTTEFAGEDWGWRFKVRLYHRMGNGYVFNSNLVDPEIPLQRFNQVLGDRLLNEPMLIRWTPGQYLKPWQGNIVPMGMAQGLIDPYDASSFDAQSKSLDDLIAMLKTEETVQSMRDQYNHYRDLTREERNMRLDLSFGFSRRRGPFWDTRRQMAKDGNYIDKIKKFVLEQRHDIDQRQSWHYHHIYARICIACGVDMNGWEFPSMSDADREMAEEFFKFNRARNKYIASRQWPNYSKWLQDNMFAGASNQEVLQRLNPGLVK